MDEMNPSSMENTWWFYQQGSDGAGMDHAHAQKATEEIAAETDLGLDELKVEEEKPPPASPRELKKLYHNPVANENEAKQSAMFPPFLKARKDFQRIFARFRAKNEGTTSSRAQRVLDAFEKDPMSRSDDDMRYIVAWMKHSRWMASLNLDTQMDLAKHRVRLTHLPAGEILFRQGDVGDAFYMIFDGGPIEVTVAGVGRVAVLQKPAAFGEIALISGAARTATIQAIQATTLVRLTADDYRLTLQGEQKQRIAKTTNFLHSQVRLFASWSKGRIRFVSQIVGRLTFKAGEVISRQGDRAAGMYFVVTGRAGLVRYYEYEKTNRWPAARHKKRGEEEEKKAPGTEAAAKGAAAGGGAPAAQGAAAEGTAAEGAAAPAAPAAPAPAPEASGVQGPGGSKMERKLSTPWISVSALEKKKQAERFGASTDSILPDRLKTSAPQWEQRTTRCRKEVLMYVCKPGDYFGEEMLWVGDGGLEHRQYTTVALTDMEVVMMNSRNAQKQITGEPLRYVRLTKTQLYKELEYIKAQYVLDLKERASQQGNPNAQNELRQMDRRAKEIRDGRVRAKEIQMLKARAKGDKLWSIIARRMKRTMRREKMNFTSLFAILDKNGDGRVLPDEMKEGFVEAIKMDLSDSDIQMLFDRFDPDGDGDMELGELLDALEAEPEEYPEGEEPESLGDAAAIMDTVARRIRRMMTRRMLSFSAIFKDFDKSGDNNVDAMELKKGLQQAIDLEMCTADAEALFAEFDEDDSGTISINELLDVFKGVMAKLPDMGPVQRIVTEKLEKRIKKEREALEQVEAVSAEDLRLAIDVGAALEWWGARFTAVYLDEKQYHRSDVLETMLGKAAPPDVCYRRYADDGSAHPYHPYGPGEHRFVPDEERIARRQSARLSKRIMDREVAGLLREAAAAAAIEKRKAQIAALRQSSKPDGDKAGDGAKKKKKKKKGGGMGSGKPSRLAKGTRPRGRLNSVTALRRGGARRKRFGPVSPGGSSPARRRTPSPVPRARARSPSPAGGVRRSPSRASHRSALSSRGGGGGGGGGRRSPGPRTRSPVSFAPSVRAGGGGRARSRSPVGHAATAPLPQDRPAARDYKGRGSDRRRRPRPRMHVRSPSQTAINQNIYHAMPGRVSPFSRESQRSLRSAGSGGFGVADEFLESGGSFPVTRWRDDPLPGEASASFMQPFSGGGSPGSPGGRRRPATTSGVGSPGARGGRLGASASAGSLPHLLRSSAEKPARTAPQTLFGNARPRRIPGGRGSKSKTVQTSKIMQRLLRDKEARVNLTLYHKRRVQRQVERGDTEAMSRRMERRNSESRRSRRRSRSSGGGSPAFAAALGL